MMLPSRLHPRLSSEATCDSHGLPAPGTLSSTVMSPLMLKPIIRPSSQWKKAVPLSVIAHGSYRG